MRELQFCSKTGNSSIKLFHHPTRRSSWCLPPGTRASEAARTNINDQESMAHLSYRQSTEILMCRRADESERRCERGSIISIPVSSGSSLWCIFIQPRGAFVLFWVMSGHTVCTLLHLISDFFFSLSFCYLRVGLLLEAVWLGNGRGEFHTGSCRLAHFRIFVTIDIEVKICGWMPFVVMTQGLQVSPSL